MQPDDVSKSVVVREPYAVKVARTVPRGGYHRKMVSLPSTTPSRFWADLSTQDFAQLISTGQAAQTIAVLPVAATEQHGPHLPLSVDTVLVEGVIAAALAHLAPELKVLFLPTQAVGLSPEHARFPGTLKKKNETIIGL